MISADHFWLLAVALAVDALVGDPDILWRRVPHPVALLGGLVGWLDRMLNREELSPAWRRLLGGIAILIVVEIAALAGFAVEMLFAACALWLDRHDPRRRNPARRPFALRSRRRGRRGVRQRHRRGTSCRRAHRRARPGKPRRARICRAAIESTAENFSDGVVAPALWFLLLGLPGLFAYKAINTADSMIGHLTDRYKDFGWAAARLDDLVNLPASRLAGLLIAFGAPAAGGSIATAFRIMLADAPKHRSPNAGWPEAAMAAALGLALAGPRHYGGIIVTDPFLNEHGRRDATPQDIQRALRVYVAANVLLFAVVGIAPAVVFFAR